MHIYIIKIIHIYREKQESAFIQNIMQLLLHSIIKHNKMYKSHFY